MDDTVGRMPYKKSWVNSWIDWIEALRLPYWVTYLIIYVLCILYIAVVLWIESPEFLRENLYLAILSGFWIPFPLASIHYLIRFADQTVTKFSSEMECTIDELESILYRIKTIPSNIAIIIPLIVGPLIYYDAIWGSQAVIGSLHTPLALILAPLFPVFGFSFIPILIYFTLRQLYLVDYMYTLVEDVNIFHLEPLYIPSRLTARTGVVWIIFLNANIFISGVGGLNSVGLVIVVAAAQIILAVSAFVFPLLGMHGKIVGEKERALEENGVLIENAYLELQAILKRNDYDSMGKLNRAIDSLMMFQTQLEATPTWPWQPETFRGFLSAVFLPIVIWIIQRLLGQMI